MQKFSGERLRELRVQAGLSREAVGVKCVRSTRAIQSWELGTHAPEGAAIGVLARLFGVSPAELFEDVA